MTEQEKVPLISADQSTQCGNGVEGPIDKGHGCCHHHDHHHQCCHGGHSRPCQRKGKSNCPFHKGMGFLGKLVLFLMLFLFFHGLFEHSTRPRLDVISGSPLELKINRLSRSSKIEFPEDWLIKINPGFSKFRKFYITTQVILTPQDDIEIRYKEVISPKLNRNPDKGIGRLERNLMPSEYFPSPSEFDGDSGPILSLIQSQCLRDGFVKGSVIVRAHRASESSCHRDRILAEKIEPVKISCSSRRDLLFVIDMIFESNDEKESREIAESVPVSGDKSTTSENNAIKESHGSILKNFLKESMNEHRKHRAAKSGRKVKRSNELTPPELELPEIGPPLVEAIADEIDSED